jgi:hypothetical protein
MKDAHNKAAEQHETAAKSHRGAAESHGKNGKLAHRVGFPFKNGFLAFPPASL